MSQIKIYGVREHLKPIRESLSNVVHECVMDALQFPADKRAHRFFYMDAEDFYYPQGRSPAYTIIEIMMITGRSTAAKKQLIRCLFERIEQQLGIAPNDLEMCIIENPPENWGFRGQHGDEVKLNYQINV
jgi:phenylpyruvate tautomerase PptA (4-oxalocrotonate tautomerase family)